MAMITSVAHTDADGSFVLQLKPNPRATYKPRCLPGWVRRDRVTGVREGAADVEFRVPPMRSVRLDPRRVRAPANPSVQRLGIKWVHPSSGRDVTLAWRQIVEHAERHVMKLELPVGELSLTLRDQDTGNVTTTALDGGRRTSYSIEI